MMKDTALQILDQTRSVLESYWQGNCEEILTYFAEDSTWIGAQLEQFYQGKVHIAQAIRQISAEMKPCYLLHQEYRLVHRDKNSCTVMGKYLATTDETAEYFSSSLFLISPRSNSSDVISNISAIAGMRYKSGKHSSRSQRLTVLLET